MKNLCLPLSIGNSHVTYSQSHTSPEDVRLSHQDPAKAHLAPMVDCHIRHMHERQRYENGFFLLIRFITWTKRNNDWSFRHTTHVPLATKPSANNSFLTSNTVLSNREFNPRYQRRAIEEIIGMAMVSTIVIQTKLFMDPIE